MAEHKYRYKSKWLLAGLFSVLLLFPCLCIRAGEQTGTLYIQYLGRTDTVENISLSGVSFVLYDAAYREEGAWVLQDAFRASQVSLKEETASARRQQAADLYAYAKAQGLEGVTTVQTGADGMAVFPQLKQGVYLVAQSEPCRLEQYGVFRSEPFLVSIDAEPDSNQKIEVLVQPKSQWQPPNQVIPPEEPEVPPGEPEQPPTTPEKPDGESGDAGSESEPEVNQPGAGSQTASSPKTGDSTAVFGCLAVFLSGVLCLAVAVRQKKQY